MWWWLLIGSENKNRLLVVEVKPSIFFLRNTDQSMPTTASHRHRASTAASSKHPVISVRADPLLSQLEIQATSSMTSYRKRSQHDCEHCMRVCATLLHKKTKKQNKRHDNQNGKCTLLGCVCLFFLYIILEYVSV